MQFIALIQFSAQINQLRLFQNDRGGEFAFVYENSVEIKLKEPLPETLIRLPLKTENTS